MKILKNYLYSLLNQIITLLVPLITIPYISRVLGPNGVGISAYTNSIISYFILFGSVGINLYGNRTIAFLRDNKMKMSKAFWEIVLLRVIMISISYLFFLLFIYFYHDYKNFLLLQSILLFAVIFDISWFFMGIEDFKKTVIRDAIVKIISLFAIFSFVKSQNDLWLYILLLACSQFLGNLTLWSYLKKLVVFIPLHRLSIFKHLKYSFHFFIPQIAIQIYAVLNKSMLGLLSDVHQVALYDNAYKLMIIILSVITAIGTIILPALTNKVAQKKHEEMNQYFTLVINMVCFLAFPFTFGLINMSQELSLLFFGSQFKGIEVVIIYLSPIIIFISFGVIFGQYFTAINQIKYLTIAVSFGALINFILNLYFIYFYAAIGAAISTLLTEFCVTCIQFYFLKRKLALSSFNGIWKYFLAAVIMFSINYIINLHYKGLLNLLLQFIIGSLSYLLLIYFLNPVLLSKLKTIKAHFKRVKNYS